MKNLSRIFWIFVCRLSHALQVTKWKELLVLFIWCWLLVGWMKCRCLQRTRTEDFHFFVVIGQASFQIVSLHLKHLIENLISQLIFEVQSSKQNSVLIPFSTVSYSPTLIFTSGMSWMLFISFRLFRTRFCDSLCVISLSTLITFTRRGSQTWPHKHKRQETGIMSVKEKAEKKEMRRKIFEK